MKMRMEVDEKIEEDEVIIRCRDLNHEVSNIQRVLEDLLLQKSRIIFYKNNVEYYVFISEVLFFETEGTSISAHTVDNIYQVKYKLYELEEILPKNFMRVSKSTIVNIDYIYSIERNLTASSIVEFRNTHKKVYASRHYYKTLKVKLLEKRR